MHRFPMRPCILSDRDCIRVVLDASEILKRFGDLKKIKNSMIFLLNKVSTKSAELNTRDFLSGENHN